MRGYMFRNRWGALLFVGFVLAGVSQLVGTGKGDGALDLAKDRLAGQRAQDEALTSGTREPEGASPKVEFVSDDELIDTALGEDPTPIDQRTPPEGEAGEEEVPHDAVILISRADAGETPPADPALP